MIIILILQNNRFIISAYKRTFLDSGVGHFKACNECTWCSVTPTHKYTPVSLLGDGIGSRSGNVGCKHWCRQRTREPEVG